MPFSPPSHSVLWRASFARFVSLRLFLQAKKSTDSKPCGLPSVALAKDGGADGGDLPPWVHLKITVLYWFLARYGTSSSESRHYKNGENMGNFSLSGENAGKSLFAVSQSPNGNQTVIPTDLKTSKYGTFLLFFNLIGENMGNKLTRKWLIYNLTHTSVLLLDFIKKSHNVKRLPVKIFNFHLCSKYPTVSGLFLRQPDRWYCNGQYGGTSN